MLIDSPDELQMTNSLPVFEHLKTLPAVQMEGSQFSIEFDINSPSSTCCHLLELILSNLL